MPPPDAKEARWFIEEVQPHEPRLRAWLAASYPGLKNLDDIIQETYLRLIRARKNGGVRSTRAFLFVAGRNVVFDLFRRQRPNMVDSVEDLTALTVLEDKPDAAETAAFNQELEVLAEAMRILPERCRQVFTLRKIYGLSQAEIAKRLGISENTVEAQVGNGAKRCKAFLRAKGITR